ncbi:hypothetical protein ACJIZ3_006271 [Penstemon smallii]|uniref:Uncharacterized protein n=1 Tax=Penstemon smallii TaxID=265156 RepID=A0ABD3S7E3_9LAMI
MFRRKEVVTIYILQNYTSAAAIEIFFPVSHTLFNPADIIQKNGGRPPLNYQSFVKLAGEPSWASSPVSNAPTWLPTVGSIGNYPNSEVPSIEELGYEEDERSPYKGGESEALRRLRCSATAFVWTLTTIPFSKTNITLKERYKLCFNQSFRCYCILSNTTIVFFFPSFGF